MDKSVDTVSVERWGSDKKLINNDAKGPQVHSVIVRQLLYEFWSHVKWSTLDRSENDSVRGHRPGESKVAQLDDTVSRNENVLRLHVSVNDSVGVEIVQSVH